MSLSSVPPPPPDMRVEWVWLCLCWRFYTSDPSECRVTDLIGRVCDSGIQAIIAEGEMSGNGMRKEL